MNIKLHTTNLLRSYVIGFVLSGALTVLAFWFSYTQGVLAIPLIVSAALLQLLTQLWYFLHLGSKETPRTYVFFLGFTVTILGIVIGGTLWIMTNLERLHMHPMTTDEMYEGGMVSPEHELH
jgi:cytochrome o ubiquinol oxidase operon protein cyoD